MQKAVVFPKMVTILLIGCLSFLISSCDDPSTPEGGQEKKEFEKAVEEQEGAEAAKEALKRKQEEEMKEAEERREKMEEKKHGSGETLKASSGLKRK